MDIKKDQKKIAVGKNGKKSQIIINPPEKVDPQRGYQEAFKRALEKHTVVMEKKTEIVLQAKAEKSQLPADVLEQVYKRGFKSLPLNTDLTREQYAMNRVNSFIAGGAAMKEDCDLLPIVEFVRTTRGMKGTGGAMRPHIKREKSPYNGRTVFHVVDSKGIVKHSSSDENEARKHLATKYNSYMEMTVSPMKRFEGTSSLVKTYKGDTPGEKPVKEEKMKGEDPCWKGYHMVGKKLKAGREVPNCVPKNEEVVVEAKMSASVRMQKALEKIKADRERRERLAEPYVKSVFKQNAPQEKAVKEAVSATPTARPRAGSTEYVAGAMAKMNMADYFKKKREELQQQGKLAKDDKK